MAKTFKVDSKLKNDSFYGDSGVIHGDIFFSRLSQEAETRLTRLRL
jgi:hypothetical protein